LGTDIEAAIAVWLPGLDDRLFYKFGIFSGINGFDLDIK
jgi:hypothetical protein